MLVTVPDPDALFAPLTQARGILLGLSGGPDSVAALALLTEWKNHPPLFAATFDHGFRAESRSEADTCAALCMQLGVPHTILTWKGEKPTTRIQEEARDARYAALVAHAKQIGADTLVTAHHADDQTETILFRMMRGSSIGGLAGMRASVERNGITHARPLLALRKDALIAICESRGLNYVRDPSNSDPRFARTQMRRLASTLEDAGMGPEAFARLAERAARAEEALAQSAAQLAQEAVTQGEDGTSRLDGQRLKNAPAELVLRLLMTEIGKIGQMPRLEQAEPLAAQVMAALAGNRPFRATLGGTLLDLTRDSALVICRESPRKSGL